VYDDDDGAIGSANACTTCTMMILSDFNRYGNDSDSDSDNTSKQINDDWHGTDQHVVTI